MKILIALSVLILSGCGSNQAVTSSTMPVTFSGIEKQAVITGSAGETSPFVFGGELYFVSYGRGSVDLSQGFVKIQHYPDLDTVSTFPFPYGYGSVLVDNGVIHLFASSESNPGNSIVTISSSDMVTWSAPQTVFTAQPDQTIYNTSPAKTATGYVLTFETHQDGSDHGWFYDQFLTSPDLVSWTQTGGSYFKVGYDTETACPLIRYVDGYYYLFQTQDNHAATGPRYTTQVTRSTDLVNFEDSSITVLSSYPRTDEGNNNSDIDMIEYQGQLFITYGVGDQTTWGAMKWATYNGTLEQFVKAFF
jgi:hypothetical protein